MDVAKALAEYGAIGLVALIMSWAAWRIYKDKEAQRLEHQAQLAAVHLEHQANVASLHGQIAELQEKRVADSNQFAEKSIEMMQVSNQILEESSRSKR